MWLVQLAQTLFLIYNDSACQNEIPPKQIPIFKWQNFHQKIL